jgi:hypothetical protein
MVDNGGIARASPNRARTRIADRGRSSTSDARPVGSQRWPRALIAASRTADVPSCAAMIIAGTASVTPLNANSLIAQIRTSAYCAETDVKSRDTGAVSLSVVIASDRMVWFADLSLLPSIHIMSTFLTSTVRIRVPLATGGLITSYTLKPPLADWARDRHWGRAVDRWPATPVRTGALQASTWLAPDSWPISDVRLRGRSEVEVPAPVAHSAQIYAVVLR